eukprot:Sro177_g077840.2  (275) ;mRNA; f:69719-70543
MAMSVYPWSLPGASEAGASTISSSNGHGGQDADSTWGLDMACMSVLWLGFLGFAIIFSALTSKIWRINQVMTFGLRFRHATVRVGNVMLPLYLSFAVNITMLLCINFVSPLQYERIPNEENVDEFGRSLESYGTCRPTNLKFHYLLGTLFITNFFGVVTVTREAYNSQSTVPSELNDADSLSWAMLSILETLMLGGPILLVVGDNPTAFFLVGSSLVCVCCLTILLLLFVPKYRDRHETHDMQSVVNAINSMRHSNLARSGSGIPISRPTPSVP